MSNHSINATINRELAALKRMFRLGQQSTPPKVVRAPKFPKLAENNVRKGFLEDGQYRMLVEYCPELWFRSLVECGRTYGWRVSELLSMRVNQLDIAQRVIRLEPGTTKNRDGREVLMTDSVHKLLSALVMASQPMITFSPVRTANPCGISEPCGRTLVLMRGYLNCYFTICGEPEHATFAERELPKESL